MYAHAFGRGRRNRRHAGRGTRLHLSLLRNEANHDGNARPRYCRSLDMFLGFCRNLRRNVDAIRNEIAARARRNYGAHGFGSGGQNRQAKFVSFSEGADFAGRHDDPLRSNGSPAGDDECHTIDGAQPPDRSRRFDRQIVPRGFFEGIPEAKEYSSICSSSGSLMSASIPAKVARISYDGRVETWPS